MPRRRAKGATSSAESIAIPPCTAQKAQPAARSSRRPRKLTRGAGVRTITASLAAPMPPAAHISSITASGAAQGMAFKPPATASAAAGAARMTLRSGTP